MICSICNKPLATNDEIVRIVACRVLDVYSEEIECVGDVPTLDAHKYCFEHQIAEESVEVVGDGVVRTDALGCFA
ncbi:hypothetical protein LCGC14_2754220 [marine sediment metagenome]|uniref:Uncharacterized protein n=1 Tax=marine sediment metagenome TaxID=412755 RepID=A0A0F9B9G2_9ZZZZ